jgi:RNA polymerase sigma-70 factor (ECF subfamily)
MDDRDLATEAAFGDVRAFSALYTRYERRVFGYFAARVRNPSLADDLCQESFLKAFQAIKSLRDPSRFGAWLFAICRNELRAAMAAARKSADESSLDEDFSQEGDPGDREWDFFVEHARLAVGLLPGELRDVVRLRCDAGLSYAMIAKTLGVGAATVKSRLHRAKARLRETLASLAEGAIASGPRLRKMEERVMDRMKQLTSLADTFESLSLAHQVALAKAAKAGEPFGEELLAGLGQAEGGANFIADRKGRMTWDEFLEAVGCVDRFTEMRLVHRLERVEPALAEALKRGLFVFEDLCIADEKVLRYLHGAVPKDLMAAALVGVQKSIRDHLLAPLAEAERGAMLDSIRQSDAGPMGTADAQLAVVEAVRGLEAKGLLRVLRADESGTGEIVITLA